MSGIKLPVTKREYTDPPKFSDRKWYLVDGKGKYLAHDLLEADADAIVAAMNERGQIAAANQRIERMEDALNYFAKFANDTNLRGIAANALADQHNESALPREP